jgi:aminoglycoside 6'-N-acetyltransferase I
MEEVQMAQIHTLTNYKYEWIHEAASLLTEAFPHSWTCMKEATDEVYQCLEDRKIALVAVEHGNIVGFIGAMPRYGTTGWELHPLVVAEAHRGNGIGSTLVQTLEKKVQSLGGIMIYLGSDDETGATSLSMGDLFEDTFEKITSITNL